MYEIPQQLIDQIVSMLEKNEFSDIDRDVLGQSLFYYCSCKDPTPIIAFGAKIPMYVYVDSLEMPKNDFQNTVEELYSRLKKHKFSLAEICNLKCTKRLQRTEKAELTLWKTSLGESFALLYIQGDASETFESLYREESDNYIVPRYVCNYRYELHDLGILKTVEKRVEYIMGHCMNPKYRCVAEYDYYGDYDTDCKVKLYRRHFYYLF